MDFSGSTIWSMRSAPNLANHCLNSSAFLDGIDWMMRKMPWVSAQPTFCSPPLVLIKKRNNLSPPFVKLWVTLFHFLI